MASLNNAQRFLDWTERESKLQLRLTAIINTNIKDWTGMGTIEQLYHAAEDHKTLLLQCLEDWAWHIEEEDKFMYRIYV